MKYTKENANDSDNSDNNLLISILVLVIILFVILAIGMTGFIIYRNKKSKRICKIRILYHLIIQFINNNKKK